MERFIDRGRTVGGKAVDLRTRILFLQGPPSPFWMELADRFSAAGVQCYRINLALGDFVYWRRRGAWNYRGSFAGWRAYLERFLIEHEITDIFYYADRFPYHVVARELGERMSIRCHSIEHGYLRPDWLTHEPGGMGRFSTIPKDPEAIRALAHGHQLPDPAVRYRHGFVVEASNDVTWNLLNFFGRGLYPLYRSDRYYNTLVDYLSWLPKLFQAPRLKRAAEKVSEYAGRTPFWLLGMQLQSDYMVRECSDYVHLGAMIDEVVGSFARHAPNDHRLAVKLHPLDGGMENWGRVVPEIAGRHGVADRVDVFDGAVLGDLLKKCEGCIVVNSTVGLYSLRYGRPTVALGSAVYNVEGLTHRSGLDSFWRHPEQPDMSLVEDLVKALAGRFQVRGDFFDPAGRAAACEEIVARTLYGRIRDV